MTKPIVLSLSLAAIAQGSFAQEDPLLGATENIVNTDQIDIDGLFAQKKQPSAADKIQEYRRKLEQKHEQMMRKKVEDMRLEEERKIARKLEKALSGQVQAMDQISTQSAAVQKVEAPAPATVEETRNNKFALSGGFMNFQGEQDLDANLNLKASVETMVSPHIAVGMSLRYVNVEMTHKDNNYFDFNGYSAYNYNYGYYGQNTYDYDYINNKFDYSSIAFSLHSKFFFSVDSKIRPFVGAALNYNRGSLENGDYENDSYDYNYYYTGYQMPKDKISVNNIGASVMAGGEVRFNNMFSAELYAQFDKSFNSSIEEDDYSDTENERYLKSLARDIEDSNIFSINAGFAFNF